MCLEMSSQKAFTGNVTCGAIPRTLKTTPHNAWRTSTIPKVSEGCGLRIQKETKFKTTHRLAHTGMTCWLMTQIGNSGLCYYKLYSSATLSIFLSIGQTGRPAHCLSDINGHAFATSAMCTSLCVTLEALKPRMCGILMGIYAGKQAQYNWDQNNNIAIFKIKTVFSQYHVWKTSTVWLTCTDWTQIRDVFTIWHYSTLTFQKAWRVDAGMGGEVGIYGDVTMATTMEHSDTLPLPASKDAAEQRNQKSSSTPNKSGRSGEWGGGGRGGTARNKQHRHRLGTAFARSAKVKS